MLRLGDVEWGGYWNASQNIIIGSETIRGLRKYLVSGPSVRPTLVRVQVAGTTNLDGISDWKVGDFAINLGWGWWKISGGQNG